jgi:membrane protein DedA with SNARE-associated domain
LFFVQHALYDFIYHYGYIALYVLLSAGIVGVPVPDETLMTFVGSLTAPGGPFSYATALIVIFAGTMTGMVVSYMLGHKVGKPFLYRFGKWIKLTPSRLDRAEGWFKRYGMWAIFFGYFVPGVRHLTCYLSGVSNVGLGKYLLYSSAGALIWCTTFLTLGHLLGANLDSMLHLFHRYLGASLGVLLVLILIGIWIYALVKKRKTAE